MSPFPGDVVSLVFFFFGFIILFCLISLHILFSAGNC